MRREMIAESGGIYEEADGLINIPLKSEDIRVSVFFKENPEGLMRCSMRSKGAIDVAEIAQRFGGGGHRTAAGFKCREPLARDPAAGARDAGRSISHEDGSGPPRPRSPRCCSPAAPIRRPVPSTRGSSFPRCRARSRRPRAAPPSQNGTLPVLIATLDRADRAVAVVNANLDADPQEEQVAAVQRRDEPAAPVRLLVLDPEFPRGRGARISWEGVTLAASARAFSVTVKDLVGDHGMQLVATGTSAEGRFTLDVFRRAAADDLVFASVCRIVADEITIEEAPRSEAYSSGLKNGASWPIVAWLRDAESGNPMDLVRVRWTWRPSENRYAAEAPEKVAGDQVGQDQLRQLYADLRPEAFEQFVAGLWTESPPPKAGPALIVQFDPATRRIAINDGETLESFAWRDTVRTLFDRVVAVSVNEAVPSMHRTFSIRATGASALAVSIRGDNEWDARELTLARLVERGAVANGVSGGFVPPGDWAAAGRARRALRGQSCALERGRGDADRDLGGIPARRADDPDGAVPRWESGDPLMARLAEGDPRQDRR